jgi:hypothetical protein
MASQARAPLLTITMLLALWNPAQADVMLTLDFNVDGVLPSAEGWTYVGDPTESAVFSVSAGQLHMDTFSLGSVDDAEYMQPQQGDYDVTLDLAFESRLRVNEIGTGPSVGFGVNDRTGTETGSVIYYLQQDAIWFFNDNTFIPFDPLDGEFHTFLLTTDGLARTFSLFVDGDLVKTGIIGTAIFVDPFSIFFGDGSTGAESDSNVDFDYVRYLNGTAAAVPEPSSLILSAIGSVGFVGVLWRRRKEGGIIRPNPHRQVRSAQRNA